MRLKHIIGDEKADPPITPIIPISKTAWWKGVAEGKYPQPIKLSEKVTVWRADEVQKLVDEICAK
jgi:prophage regulatory protein